MSLQRQLYSRNTAKYDQYVNAQRKRLTAWEASHAKGLELMSQRDDVNATSFRNACDYYVSMINNFPGSDLGRIIIARCRSFGFRGYNVVEVPIEELGEGFTTNTSYGARQACFMSYESLIKSLNPNDSNHAVIKFLKDKCDDYNPDQEALYYFVLTGASHFEAYVYLIKIR